MIKHWATLLATAELEVETPRRLISTFAEALSLPRGGNMRVENLSFLSILHRCAITTQYLSLALFSYTRAHCGMLRPFFIDTAQKKSVLLGLHIPHEENPFQVPRVEGQIVRLTCMGQMIQQPVFLFRFLDSDKRWNMDTSQSYDLLACAEDILGTWGPGNMAINADDGNQVCAISVGGGYIAATKTETNTTYHWTRGKLPAESFTASFGRQDKLMIGARVVENAACTAVTRDQLNSAAPFLQELRTFSSSWQVSERQAGIQAGQYTTL